MALGALEYAVRDLIPGTLHMTMAAIASWLETFARIFLGLTPRPVLFEDDLTCVMAYVARIHECLRI